MKFLFEGMQMKQILLIASLLSFMGTQVSAVFLINSQEWNAAACKVRLPVGHFAY